MQKYRNKKCKQDGLSFDSKRERKRYNELLLLVKAGEIIELKQQVKFDFIHNKVKICTYIADFTYVENYEFIVEDVKSEITRKNAVYRLKKKLMKAFYGIEIREIL